MYQVWRGVKPSTSFYVHKASPDGLAWTCRDCQSAYRAKLKKREKNLPTTKRCCKCGHIKPQGEFGRHARSIDGLRSRCKECRNNDDKALKIRQAAIINEANKRCAVNTWSQVGDVLREMAEIQVSIHRKTMAMKRQVFAVVQDNKKQREPYELNLAALRELVGSFLIRNCPRDTITFKRFRFGTVRFSSQRVDCGLNTELAEEMQGMP